MGTSRIKTLRTDELMLRVSIEALPEGGYLATSTVLPGLIAQGRTIAETMEIAQDVARKLIESYLEHGDPLPAKLKARTAKHLVLQVPVAVGR